jgi:hypothetical protein
MPTPLEKLTSDWQTHYSDIPMDEFVKKVHAKMYSDIPFADFTDKMGITVPPEDLSNRPQEPSPMSPVEGASPWETGQVPPFGEFARKAAPIIAGGAAGMIPGVGGLIAGPLAAAATDIAVNPKDATTGERETSFLTDVGAGLLPGSLKGAYGVAKKLIPAPLEAKLASVIKYGFEKGVRPTVVGKSNAAQTEKYYEKAQTAVETIVNNKPNLVFYDDMGNTVKGKLPSNLEEFSQSIDQTKRSTFNQYDAMLKSSNDLGRTVNLSPVASEMRAFSSDKVNVLTGGSGLKRAKELEEMMSGEQLTLVQAQDLLANLNNRTKAYMKNPSPDQVSGYAVDLLAANNLRRALDSAVENSGYMGLRRDYGSLREIEKEVSNRALVDARKNTKGLLDFTDIYTAAEMARAIGSMSAGGAATAGIMRGIKEYYKHLNNPNRVVKNMFKEADSLMGRRPTGSSMKALPPGPRPMGSGIPDKSGIIRGGQEIVPAEKSSYYEDMWRKYADRNEPQFQTIPKQGLLQDRAPMPSEYPYEGKKMLALPPSSSGGGLRSVDKTDIQTRDQATALAYFISGFQKGNKITIDYAGDIGAGYKSTYPVWFKSIFPSESADYVSKTIHKWETGAKLGKREQNVMNKVVYMIKDMNAHNMDVVTEQPLKKYGSEGFLTGNFQ